MNTPLPAVVPAPGQPRTSMDELMLAMDIVDTLRHEQSLVERELASTKRDEDFVARVKQIYANQGIDVSDALVRQGVEALKQDRFAYTPPKRTFAVRLAEVWVDRWRWVRRSLIASLVLGIGYAVVAIPNAWVTARRYRDYTEAAEGLQRAGQAVVRDVDALKNAAEEFDSRAPKSVADHLKKLAANYYDRRSTFAPALAAAVALEPVGPAEYAADPRASYARLGAVDRQLNPVQFAARDLDAQMKAGLRLFGAAERFEHVSARLQSMHPAESVTARLAEARSRAEGALAAADDAAASTTVGELERLAASLDLAYTLRIVNREGVQSGVWRYHEDAPGGKNYYLVVEAIDANGQSLTLPITNEETQRIETVSLFALRVPQAEYDKVKADKLDNGLIDEAVVGEKRRGELDVDYRVAVAGGAITEW